MKKSTYLLIGLLISTIGFISCGEDVELPVIPETDGTASGTALIITGASARITQQVALLERMNEQGRFNDLRFISGVSSGAINSIMMNGILDSTNTFGFDEYKDIILNLSNDDVFVNTRNDLPVDTRPLWNTFETTFFNVLNYGIFQDLPFPTALTNTDLDLMELRVSSNVSELDQIGGNLVESLMATTSFPVAFPSIRINDKIYVDGGLTENIPVNVALQYQQLQGVPFDTIYIVTYQKNETIRWDEELKFLGLTGTRDDILEVTLTKAGFDTDQQSQKAFLDDLERIRNNYPEFADRCYVYEPNVANPGYYGVFDFSRETAISSYNSVSTWAQANDPLRLDAFLEQNGRGPEQ